MKPVPSGATYGTAVASSFAGTAIDHELARQLASGGDSRRFRDPGMTAIERAQSYERLIETLRRNR